MTDAASRDHIVSVGLSPAFEGELARMNWALSSLDPATLGPTLQHARILLVGDGISGDDLVTVIAVAREIAPSTRILLVSRNLVASREMAEVDAVYEFPRDAPALLRDIGSILEKKAARTSIAEEAVTASLGFVILLALWALVASLEMLPPFLLPAPLDVARAFVADSRRFASDFAVTGLEALLGFMIGNMSGILVAVLLYPSHRIRALSLPARTGERSA